MFSFSFSASDPTALKLLQDAGKRAVDSIFLRGSSTGCSAPVELRLIVKSQNAPILNEETNETYVLSIGASAPFIEAQTVFGAMHGLETLVQLVNRSQATAWTLPSVEVQDNPRFAFRGFLHDTARHFLTVPVIKQLIDALAASKYNVFHWHITDDQSCPYVSTALPHLSKGAFGGLSSHTYSPSVVQEVIEYAYARGVRVVPEFDTPGHVGAMGVGYPDLVTRCYSNGTPNGKSGPVNPINETNFDLLSALWNEVATVFKDDYVHLGGDEVSFDCWMSNPEIQAFMKAKGWTENYNLLEQFYEQALIKIVEKTGKKYIVWQEIFDNGLKIAPETIVDVWKNSPWQDELASVTKAGYSAILSAPWYLNYIENPYPTKGDWQSYYLVEPLDFEGSEAQKQLVIGGEGTMWAEYASNSNVVSRTWPRAAAVGERLWSPRTVRDVDDAAIRIQKFSCELIRRGIPSEPVTGPSYCQYELNVE